MPEQLHGFNCPGMYDRIGVRSELCDRFAIYSNGSLFSMIVKMTMPNRANG